MGRKLEQNSLVEKNVWERHCTSDSTKYGENLGRLNSYQLLRKTVFDEASLVTYRNIRYFLPSRCDKAASRENTLVYRQVTPPSSKFPLFLLTIFVKWVRKSMHTCM